MKVRQANGDAPRINNYCTAREYEVFVLIAKNEEYKEGDTISGETLKNKTIGRTWRITECDRRDGGEVSITISHIDAGRVFFTVKIGGKENQVKGGELVDYIDKRVEFVENYEQAVKDSMTDEEFEMFSGIRHVVIL